MSLFNLWGQKNSVLLEFDHFDELSVDSLLEQIQEVRKYYRFSKVGEIAERLRSNKRQGLAALCFKNPRKSFFLRAAPYLLDNKIPFTLFLRPDCIGLNKLPLEEELRFYSEKYPEQITQEIFLNKMGLIWYQPEKVESYLRELRSSLGPLPLERIDPTFFFATWGKIFELPRDLVEWGVTLTVAPSRAKLIEDEILFMRQQLGGQFQVARIGAGGQGAISENSNWDALKLNNLNFSACVTEREGAVTQESDWWDLPVWRFST